MYNKKKIFFKKISLLFIALIIVVSSSIFFSIFWRNNINFVIFYLKEIVENSIKKLLDFKANIPESKYNLQSFKSLQKQNYPTVKITDTIAPLLDTALYLALWEKYIKEPAFQELDSLTLDSFIKSEMRKTEATETNYLIEQEKIKGDTLLHIKVLIPEIVEVSDGDTSNLNKEILKTPYTIQFWNSPLKYKGYKVLRNLISIYGIENFDDIKLFSDRERQLYLKYDNKIYLLKNDGLYYAFDNPY